MALLSPEQRQLERKQRDLHHQEERLARETEHFHRERSKLDEHKAQLDQQQRLIQETEARVADQLRKIEQKEGNLKSTLLKFDQEKEDFIKSRRARLWVLSIMILLLCVLAGYFTYELRDRSTQLYQQQQQAHSNIEKLTESYQWIEREKNNAEANLASAQHSLEQAKADFTGREAELRNQIKSLETEKAHWLQQSELDQEKIITLEKQLLAADQITSRLREELSGLADDKAKLDSELQSMEVRLGVVGKQLLMQKNQHEQTHQDLELALQDVKSWKQLAQNLEATQEQTKKSAANSLSETAALRDELKQRNKDLSIVNHQLNGVLSRLEAAKEEKQELTNQLQQQSEILSQRTTELNQLRQKVEALTGQ